MSPGNEKGGPLPGTAAVKRREAHGNRSTPHRLPGLPRVTCPVCAVPVLRADVRPTVPREDAYRWQPRIWRYLTLDGGEHRCLGGRR